MNEHDFADLVDRFLEGTLLPEERTRLCELIDREPARRHLFEQQVEMNMRLGGALKTHDHRELVVRINALIDSSSEGARRRNESSRRSRWGDGSGKRLPHQDGRCRNLDRKMRKRYDFVKSGFQQPREFVKSSLLREKRDGQDPFSGHLRIPSREGIVF